ncbi:MAG: hypothetical protein ACP5PB_05295 [Acidimicrobiales bacterium]
MRRGVDEGRSRFLVLVELRADEMVGLTPLATPGLVDGVSVTEGIL